MYAVNADHRKGRVQVFQSDRQRVLVYVADAGSSLGSPTARVHTEAWPLADVIGYLSHWYEAPLRARPLSEFLPIDED